MTYFEAVQILQTTPMTCITTSSSVLNEEVMKGMQSNDVRRQAEEVVASFRTCVSCKWHKAPKAYNKYRYVAGGNIPYGGECASPKIQSHPLKTITGKESDGWREASFERLDWFGSCGHVGRNWEPK